MAGSPGRNNSSTREAGARIEALLDELERAEPGVRDRAEELVRLLAEMYGGALERVLEILRERGAEGAPVVAALGEDELVGGLLSLHGLHPVSVEDRVGAALDSVRPYLGSHAGGVELLGIDDDAVVRLRLQGSCDGCASSAMTVQLAIETAILDAAPEVVEVVVEGVTADPQPLLQIQPSPYRSEDAPASVESGDGWCAVDGAMPAVEGTVAPATAAGFELVVVRLPGGLYAYRDACPGCGGRLGEAALEGATLTCPTCRALFDVHHAGRNVDGSGDHLVPFPLLPDPDGGVRVALPAVAAGTPS